MKSHFKRNKKLANWQVMYEFELMPDQVLKEHLVLFCQIAVHHAEGMHVMNNYVANNYKYPPASLFFLTTLYVYDELVNKYCMNTLLIFVLLLLLFQFCQN